MNEICCPVYCLEVYYVGEDDVYLTRYLDYEKVRADAISLAKCENIRSVAIYWSQDSELVVETYK